MEIDAGLLWTAMSHQGGNDGKIDAAIHQILGRWPLSHRPHLFSRASVYAIVCGLTPLARYSSMYESNSRSHRLIASLLNITNTNNKTSNKTSLEAAMSPELN